MDGQIRYCVAIVSVVVCLLVTVIGIQTGIWELVMCGLIGIVIGIVIVLVSYLIDRGVL